MFYFYFVTDYVFLWLLQGSRGTGKVHNFGKRDHAIKRNLNIPVVVRGWLYKQVRIFRVSPTGRCVIQEHVLKTEKMFKCVTQ